MPKIIINACLTGMVPTADMTPHVPISPKQIVECALECIKLGASVIHVHARNPDGTPTWKKTIFEEIIKGIRAVDKDVVISVTTSGRNWSEFEKRSECLEISGKLKPDFASLTVGSLNFIRTASVNTPDMITKLALKMKEKGIKPELEIFEPGMIHMTKYLIKKEIISPDRPYFNLFFGSLGTMPLEPASLAVYHALLPQGAIWSVGGVGDYQLDANVMSLSMGGHVRVGLEDHIYFDRKREKLASNQNLIERLVKMIKLMDLEVATSKEAREMLL
jgi:3-keto-5-aminohexanoate cleavage enzyme